MSKRSRRIRTAITGAALSAGVAIMAAAATGDDADAGWFTSDQVRCEIDVKPGPYGIQLQGLVFAEEMVSGEYELSVKQDGYGGHSMINQAGGFHAVPDTPARLGVVTLGGNGASYTAKLKVHAGGETYVCAKRVGGRI